MVCPCVEFFHKKNEVLTHAVTLVIFEDIMSVMVNLSEMSGQTPIEVLLSQSVNTAIKPEYWAFSSENNESYINMFCLNRETNNTHDTGLHYIYMTHLYIIM